MIKNRWMILVVSVVINLCIGFAYAWSVFQKPLMETFGWSSAQASLVFTINLAVLPLAMIVAGRLVKKIGVRGVVLTGGFLFGLGIFLSSMINSIGALYFTYGLVAGSGIGLIYSCTVSNTVKWFPDKKGLAGGLTAGGFGAGSIIFAPVAVTFISTQGVLGAFRILGLIFSGVILLLGLLMSSPPEESGVVEEKTADQSGKRELNTREMLKNPDFYMIWILMVLGCISGLMIISQASPIGQAKVGLSQEEAAFAVGFIGLANATGRVFWGMVSDKIGRYQTLIMMFLFSSLGLILLVVTSALPLFLAAICLIAASYGGVFGLFPSITADLFGVKNMGMNYGVVMTGLSVGAIIGPQIAAFAVEASGYDLAFIITVGINLAALILVLLAKRKSEQLKTANS
ncbi:OFA family MFS transporter [Eubacteriaceae bacterium ES3]|nr:OFA family MFS transporter [Eubacteriaceae bacterium ES3]